jgi:regulator of sigma E protease
MKVSAVYKDSPARKAGLQPGDIIKGYADHPTPTLRQFLKISDDVLGDKTRITVLRDGKSMTLEIAPKKAGDNAIVGIIQTSDLEHPVVATVREGSPAAKAGIIAGAEIVAINNRKIHSWIDLLEALKKIQKQTPDNPVTLTARLGAEEKTYQLGKLNKNVFRSDDYRAHLFTNEAFRPLTVTIVHRNPLAAIAWGAEETFRLILSTYGTLRSMLRGSVSTKAVSGPVGIARAAIIIGRNGLLDLVNLMAIISASLAVINFLPLPVLDGGHAVLLIIEKVRRKPLPMKLINIIQMTGLVLILGLFIVLTWNDIAQWIAG